MLLEHITHHTVECPFQESKAVVTKTVSATFDLCRLVEMLASCDMIVSFSGKISKPITKQAIWKYWNTCRKGVIVRNQHKFTKSIRLIKLNFYPVR